VWTSLYRCGVARPTTRAEEEQPGGIIELARQAEMIGVRKVLRPVRELERAGWVRAEPTAADPLTGRSGLRRWPTEKALGHPEDDDAPL
jgi:hypothetical protein